MSAARAGAMKRATVRTIGWAAAAAVLLLVFAAYLRPDMAYTLATQLWNCI